MLVHVLTQCPQILSLTPNFDLKYQTTQQRQGQTNFSIIIYIYTYKNIQKVLLLEFVQGEIVFAPYYISLYSFRI